MRGWATGSERSLINPDSAGRDHQTRLEVSGRYSVARRLEWNVRHRVFDFRFGRALTRGRRLPRVIPRSARLSRHPTKQMAPGRKNSCCVQGALEVVGGGGRCRMPSGTPNGPPAGKSATCRGVEQADVRNRRGFTKKPSRARSCLPGLSRHSCAIVVYRKKPCACACLKLEAATICRNWAPATACFCSVRPGDDGRRDVGAAFRQEVGGEHDFHLVAAAASYSGTPRAPPRRAGDNSHPPRRRMSSLMDQTQPRSQLARERSLSGLESFSGRIRAITRWQEPDAEAERADGVHPAADADFGAPSLERLVHGSRRAATGVRSRLPGQWSD